MCIRDRIISGGSVTRCVIGPEVRVNSYAKVSDSILFDRVQVGKHAVIKNAIIDKGVVIPDYAQIGLDPELDHKRGFTVTESGLTVIGKFTSIPTTKQPGPHFTSQPNATSEQISSDKKPR